MLKIRYTIFLTFGMIGVASLSEKKIVAMQAQAKEIQEQPSFFTNLLSVLWDHWNFMSEAAKKDNKKNMETLNAIENFLLGVSEPAKEGTRESKSKTDKGELSS